MYTIYKPMILKCISHTLLSTNTLNMCSHIKIYGHVAFYIPNTYLVRYFRGVSILIPYQMHSTLGQLLRDQLNVNTSLFLAHSSTVTLCN